MARRSYRFRPYVPPQPPSGSYDPSLDAQQGASQRGLQDLQRDIETQGTRATNDYGLQTEQLGTQAGQSIDDYTRQLMRGRADLGTSFTRGSQDHDRAINMLTRQYGILGSNQTQAANTAGVLRGGAALQAAVKRRENMAVDRQPIDTSWDRQRQDLETQRLRMEDDYGRNTQQVAQQRDWGLGELGLGYGRGNTDRTTQLTRAQREAQAFGLDIGAQRAYQAAGANWAPPGRGEPGGMPRNEFVNPAGTHYQIVRRGNQSVAYDPRGRVLWRRPVRGR